MQQTEQFKITLMLELSKELKITIINMLKGTTEKVNNMHEKIGNFSREILKIKWKVRNKKCGNRDKKKMFSVGSSVDTKQQRKEAVNLMTGQQKLPKSKHKEKEKRVDKNKTKHLRSMEYHTV